MIPESSELRRSDMLEVQYPRIDMNYDRIIPIKKDFLHAPHLDKIIGIYNEFVGAGL
jgi:hypothetical protein